MPERDRTQAHCVLDVLLAGPVPDMTALAADHEARGIGWKLVVTLGVGVTAARNQAMGQFLQFAFGQIFVAHAINVHWN